MNTATATIAAGTAFAIGQRIWFAEPCDWTELTGTVVQIAADGDALVRINRNRSYWVGSDYEWGVA